MLGEDRFESLNFFAEPFALCQGSFQQGSKIGMILHQSTPCNNSAGSGTFRVNYREPLQSGNVTEYCIRRDKIIHQLLVP